MSNSLEKFLNPSYEVRFMKQALPVENKDYNMQHLEELLSVKESVKEPDIVNIPDVVEIIEDPVVEPIKEETREEVKVYEKEMESINPFQSGSVPVSDRLPINRVYDNIYSEIIKNENIAKEEIKEPEVVDNNRLVLQDGSVNIPKVIGKVREFVNSLDELKGVITTSEVDYDGKYQIIIEIDKK